MSLGWLVAIFLLGLNLAQLAAGVELASRCRRLAAHRDRLQDYLIAQSSSRTRQPEPNLTKGLDVCDAE